MGGKHSHGKPVNARKYLSTSLVCCGKPLICLHSFWTPPFALSKSVAPEEKAIYGLTPDHFPIG
jgi:hypothetical protein